LPLVPSIVDAMPAGGMAAVLSDPAQRAVHVDTIVSFAEQGDYDGIDLDYEQFAFADPRDTWAATRPHWVAFVAELAGRLHAQGRTLTVSIPPVYDADRTADSGYWVYDHGAIAEHVDRIRIMAYDFSTSSPGPIAPLDWVRRAIDGTVAATGDPEKLVLGIPLYGYNWPVGVAGTCPPDGDVGRTAITIRTVDDLVALRGATPLYDPVAGEWSATYDLVIEGDGADGAGRVSCTQRRQVQYVDAEGARLRIDLARAARLGGVALWAFGYDDATLWTAIAEIVRPPGR
jgi:spore germination protein YaaH